MIAELNEAIDAGAATTSRTFRYTEAEEARKILTDAEVTVVLQGPRFQAWKNFVDHGDFLGAQGEINTATAWGKLLLRAKIFWDAGLGHKVDAKDVNSALLYVLTHITVRVIERPWKTFVRLLHCTATSPYFYTALYDISG